MVIEITDSQSAKDKNRHGIMPNLIDAGNMITEWKRGSWQHRIGINEDGLYLLPD